MHTVIPLGRGSKWNNNELKYSLRSANYSELWLVGEKPEWINCNHIPHQDGGAPTLNIWNKVRKACLNPEVSDPFLFANDDYFYLRPIPEDYPYYYGDLRGNNTYKKIAHYTMAILRKAGMTDYFYDVHRPMIIHKELFLAAYSYFEFHLKIGHGLVMKSCYGNFAEVNPVHCVDIKYAYWGGAPDVDMFSIGDGCIDLRFKAYCNQMWPDKSKFEK